MTNQEESKPNTGKPEKLGWGRQRIKQFFRRRIAKRIERKLGLSAEQAAELMPILGGLRGIRQRPDRIEMAQLEALLVREELNHAELDQWIDEQVHDRQKKLDTGLRKLSTFISGLGIEQRQKIAILLTKSHCGHGCGRRCHS